MAQVITDKDKSEVGQLLADLRQGKSVAFTDIKPWRHVVLRSLQCDTRKSFNLMKSFNGRIYLAPWGFKNAIQDVRDTVLLCGLDL